MCYTSKKHRIALTIYGCNFNSNRQSFSLRASLCFISKLLIDPNNQGKRVSVRNNGMKIFLVLLGLLSMPLIDSSALAEICGPDHEHNEDKQKQDK